MLRSASLLFCAATLSIPAARPERGIPPAAPVPKKNVAILNFDNYSGSPDYDALGKGIASMMISDLSKVEEIQLLERDRMEDLIKEVDNQHTKYFDSTTAVRVGKMVGAEYVVVGEFSTVKPQMRIDTRVVRVATGEIMKSAQVTGDENKFFDLEKALADRLVDGLGLALSPEEQAQLAAQEEQNRVDAVSAMNGFSQGLAMYDQGDYVGAAQHMAPAAKASPHAAFISLAFDAARKRAAAQAADKSKNKINSALGGFLKRPPSSR